MGLFKMEKQKVLTFGLIVVLVIGIIFISGCVEEEGEEAAPTKPSEGAEVPETITEEEAQTELLATATHGSVMTMTKNWDADAEDDGIIVYPDLKDATGETVKFEGIELPIEIKIYTLKMDENWNEVKDRLVYSGSSTIDSWKDGNFMFEGGIKIPFEDIKAIESDEDYGAIYVTVTLPDGRTIESKEDFGVRIKPETS